MYYIFIIYDSIVIPVWLKTFMDTLSWTKSAFYTPKWCDVSLLSESPPLGCNEGFQLVDNSLGVMVSCSHTYIVVHPDLYTVSKGW